MSDKMRSIPNYADLITWELFRDAVKSGAFINYDGNGYYATSTKMSDRRVDCSAIFKEQETNGEYTHVAWFNK